jgi:ATP-dependent RNA helicase DeaD
MKNFTDFDLPPLLIKALTNMGYTIPTPIQTEAIPAALQGKDILGSAQTGTGKTAAFVVPLINYLMKFPDKGALVLTPTRELAVQVLDVARKMLNTLPAFKTALLIGGEPMPPQFARLRACPRLIIGTPGRINDHLSRGSLQLGDTGFLVLDEADRMLDMGFGVQLDKIVLHLPKERQTLMFSATMPNNIKALSQKYLVDPIRIEVGTSSQPALSIKQEITYTTAARKYEELMKELDQREGSIIVFVKTKWGADLLSEKLNKQNYSTNAIHGDLRQNRRERIIKDFRNRSYRIMVATDIAARGLDIPHVAHIINYDLPQCPEDYIHRIGRTGRCGAEGSALCLITPEDKKRWQAIDRLINPQKGGGSANFNHKEPREPRKTGSFDRPKKPFSHDRKPQGKRFGERKGDHFSAKRKQKA